MFPKPPNLTPDVLAELDRLAERLPTDELVQRARSRAARRHLSRRDREELEHSIPGAFDVAIHDVAGQLEERGPEEVREIVLKATVRCLVELYLRPRGEVLGADADLHSVPEDEPSTRVNLLRALFVAIKDDFPDEATTEGVPPLSRRRARLRQALEQVESDHGLSLDRLDLALRLSLMLGRRLDQLGPGSDRLRRGIREFVGAVQWPLVDATAQQIRRVFGVDRRTALIAAAKTLHISGTEAAQAWPLLFATRDVFNSARRRLPADLREALERATDEAGPLFAPEQPDA